MQANDLRFNELGNMTGLAALLGEQAPKVVSAPAPIQPRAPYVRIDRRLATPEGQALLKCGLWLRTSFVGASVAAMGVVLLGEGGVQPVYGVLLTALGVPLAIFAWRRARAAIERIDAPIERANVATDTTGAA